MARISRKNPQTAPQELSFAVPKSETHTALYARLSIEDNGKANGESMENQIALLREFATSQNASAPPVLYVDNGFTGTDFDRPEFVRMMADVRAGKIDCIVVKDLSRLGRNYIETGEFIERIFPFFGIRLIAVNDGFDTATLSSTDELSASLKNIVNDFYAKDISRKTASALCSKRLAGKFIGPYAPYGYQKDPLNKNHLLPDQNVVPHLRQIYQWRADGMGYGTILDKLNRIGIPSPGRYRFENGIITNNNKRGGGLLWNRHVLTDILRNTVYLGRLEQGKSTASLADGIPLQSLPRDRWTVAEQTHESIIDDALFEAVQRVNSQRSDEYHANYGKYGCLPKRDNLYGKKLVCADCGSVLKLVRSINRNGTRAYFNYLCPFFDEHRELSCTQKNIRKSELDSAVLSTLRMHMNLFLDAQCVLVQLQAQQEVFPIEPQTPVFLRVQKQIARKQTLSTQLYADYRDGILTREEYQYTKRKYETELERLHSQVEALTGKTQQATVPQEKEWAKLTKRYAEQIVLTHEMVDAFVEKIELSQDNTITLHLRYEDEYRAVCAAAEESKEVA